MVAVHDLILEYCIEEAGHLPQLHNIYLSRGINVARFPSNFFYWLHNKLSRGAFCSWEQLLLPGAKKSQTQVSAIHPPEFSTSKPSRPLVFNAHSTPPSSVQKPHEENTPYVTMRSSPQNVVSLRQSLVSKTAHSPNVMVITRRNPADSKTPIS